jgi:hypothetical protein
MQRTKITLVVLTKKRNQNLKRKEKEIVIAGKRRIQMEIVTDLIAIKK